MSTSSKPAKIVSFQCLLMNRAGQLIGRTYNRDVLAIANPAPGLLLRALSRELTEMKQGQKQKIEMKADEAYGPYDPKKVILFPRSKMPTHISVGESIIIVGKSGAERSYRVTGFFDEMASLDGNHPLAGQDLIFEVEVLNERPATNEEVDEALNRVEQQKWH